MHLQTCMVNSTAVHIMEKGYAPISTQNATSFSAHAIGSPLQFESSMRDTSMGECPAAAGEAEKSKSMGYQVSGCAFSLF